MDYQRLPKLLTNSEVSVSSSGSLVLFRNVSRVRILNILRVIKVILIGKLDLQIVVSASKHSALICFSCELGKPLSHTTRNLTFL